MFKSIRRRITLTNTLILVAFLLFFIIFFGFMIENSFTASGENDMREEGERFVQEVAASKENAGSIESKKNLFGPRTFDYILWNADMTSERMRVTDTALILTGRELVGDATETGTFQTFVVNDCTYRFYVRKFIHGKDSYVIEVFDDISIEREMISRIVGILLLIGIGGVVLLIPISYFLAGRSIEPIRQSYEGQKKFIGDASHELRTPLTVIQTSLEVLRMKEDEVLEDNIRWLNNIDHEVNTMSVLVSELLTIAQAENKGLVVKKELFDLSALCVEITDLMFDLAEEKGILLASDIQPDVEYKGTEEHLKRAIRILVDNAIKYTPEPGKVTLKLSEGPRNVVIAVSDTGVGLSPEDQQKVFSRFYRVDDARSRKSGGVGLGLNIADVIVKQHNGKIKIDSKEGEGSTFSIVLPRTR